MPPEQNQNKNQNPPAARNPAIRTMKTDAEEFLKTTKPSLAQMAGTAPQATLRAPSSSPPRKLQVRMVAIVFGILALLGAGAFLFVRILSSVSSPATKRPAGITRVLPPPAYFASETSRTITVKRSDRQEFFRLINDAWHEKERQGTVKRIIIKVQDGPNERFATLQDFFDLWRIAPPQELIDQADPNLMVFIYYEASGSRLGIAVHARDSERMFAAMFRWEPSLLAQVTPLFFDERTETIVAPFEDRTYRNIDWRYLKLSQNKDLGIGYGIFSVNNVFFLTTSKETAETTINRLFDAR